MFQRLKSRKLWLAVASSVFLTLASELGIDSDLAMRIVAPLLVYIAGQSAVDAAEKFKG